MSDEVRHQYWVETQTEEGRLGRWGRFRSYDEALDIVRLLAQRPEVIEAVIKAVRMKDKP